MNRTLTENCAVTLSTTSKRVSRMSISPDRKEEPVGARVDLFFSLLRGIPELNLKRLISASWQESRLDTLKIILHGRAIRTKGTNASGKGERQITFMSIKILAEDCEGGLHAVIQNLWFFEKHGRFLDYVVIAGTVPCLENACLDFLVAKLREDLNLPETKKPSLLAKWLPSRGKKHDKQFGTVKKIRTRMGWTDHVYRLNIVGLRARLNLLENFMSKRKFNKIDYSAVPSVAFKRHRKAFERNDGKRYKNFLNVLEAQQHKEKERDEALARGEEVEEVKQTVRINVAQLYPHEILEVLEKGNVQLANCQWAKMIRGLSEKNLFQQMLPIMDVSPSMDGLPKQVCLALGLAIASTMEGPLQRHVITFSSDPQLHVIDTKDNLHTCFTKLKAMDWGGSTDFQKTIDMVLTLAIAHNLEALPKLIVFSDMEFDAANGGAFTNDEVLRAKFREAGYAVPAIVYWNLRSSSASSNYPVPAKQSNVALLSGFSPSLFKLVGDGDFGNPYVMLRKALDADMFRAIKL